MVEWCETMQIKRDRGTRERDRGQGGLCIISYYTGQLGPGMDEEALFAEIDGLNSYNER